MISTAPAAPFHRMPAFVPAFKSWKSIDPVTKRYILPSDSQIVLEHLWGCSINWKQYMPEIAHRMGYSRERTQKAVREAEEHGFLARKYTGRTPGGWVWIVSSEAMSPEEIQGLQDDVATSRKQFPELWLIKYGGGVLEEDSWGPAVERYNARFTKSECDRPLAPGDLVLPRDHSFRPSTFSKNVSGGLEVE